MEEKILKYIANGNYVAFKKFVSNPANLKSMDSETAIRVYMYSPKWAKVLLMNLQPLTERIGHTICIWQPQSIVTLWAEKWGITESIAIEILKNGRDIEARKIVTALSQKISPEVELAMLERNDVDLLKIWLQKFGILEMDNEIALNDNPKMSALLRYYIELRH